jgi:hypothetical protein
MKTIKNKNKQSKKNKTLKNIVETDKEEKVIFVFYTFSHEENPASWSYSKLPKGWLWVGSGKTSPVKGKNMTYENEEQFSGPKATQQKTINYLETFFKKIKQKKYIKRFKVKTSYLP